MKLSEIKGERTLEVIAELIDPIANIAEDENASLLFKKTKGDSKDKKKDLLKKIRKSVPSIVKNHKDDIISIFSTLSGKTKEEYTNKLDLLSLIKDFTELVTDDCFITLFISAQTMEEDSVSGTVQENM